MHYTIIMYIRYVFLQHKFLYMRISNKHMQDPPYCYTNTVGSLRDVKLLLPSSRSQHKSQYLASNVSRQNLFNFRTWVSVQISILTVRLKEAKSVEIPHKDSYRFITNFGTKKCQVKRGILGKKSQNYLKNVRHKIVQHRITSGRFLKLSQSSKKYSIS